MPFESTPRMVPGAERDLLAGNVSANRRGKRNACRSGRSGRRRPPGSGAHQCRHRPSRRAGDRHWDAGRPRSRRRITKPRSAAAGSCRVLDLKADPRQGVGDRLDVGLGLQVILQPAERELHGVSKMPGAARRGGGPSRQSARPWPADARRIWDRRRAADERHRGRSPRGGRGGARQRLCPLFQLRRRRGGAGRLRWRVRGGQCRECGLPRRHLRGGPGRSPR